jgi:hypothetical protein
MRAARQAARHEARHRADGPADLGREVRGGQRAGLLRRLDDDGRRGERGDDPVAGHEAPAVRVRARGHLRDHRAALGDGRVQPPAARRIGDVRARGEHADRRPGRLERARVRRRIDPERQPRDDRYPRGRQAATDAARDVEPVRGCAPRPDHGDAVRIRQRVDRPEHVQDRRRVGEVSQARRIGVGAPADDLERRRGRSLPRLARLEARVPIRHLSGGDDV